MSIENQMSKFLHSVGVLCVEALSYSYLFPEQLTMSKDLFNGSPYFAIGGLSLNLKKAFKASNPICCIVIFFSIPIIFSCV